MLFCRILLTCSKKKLMKPFHAIKNRETNIAINPAGADPIGTNDKTVILTLTILKKTKILSRNSRTFAYLLYLLTYFFLLYGFY